LLFHAVRTEPLPKRNKKHNNINTRNKLLELSSSATGCICKRFVSLGLVLLWRE